MVAQALQEGANHFFFIGFVVLDSRLSLSKNVSIFFFHHSGNLERGVMIHRQCFETLAGFTGLTCMKALQSRLQDRDSEIKTALRKSVHGTIVLRVRSRQRPL
jgi:hypothetical protein